MFLNSRKIIIAALLFFASQVSAQNLPIVVSLAKEQKWEELASLLEDGLNPNVVYGDGTTALHWASYHNSSEAADNLLSSGADVNTTTDLGVTPLWLAAENGSIEMVEALNSVGIRETENQMYLIDKHKSVYDEEGNPRTVLFADD